LNDSLLGWMVSLYNISEQEILEHAGLDAFVFLGFFKTAITLLSLCTLCAVTIISPIRLHFTGNYDQGGDDVMTLVARGIDFLMSRRNSGGDDTGDPHAPEEYESFLWVYVIFTYVFTGLATYVFFRQTMKVLKVRQKYLGAQNSITDRTIRVSGISANLRTEPALKEHIESLGIGTVSSVSLCRNWEKLDMLFDHRNMVIEKLERAWSDYLGPTWEHDDPEDYLPLYQSSGSSQRTSDDEDSERTSLLPRSTQLQLGISGRAYKRPLEKIGFLGLFGPAVDIIDHYSTILEEIDACISEAREHDFPATGTAFVTMDSVASAQMTAQAVLDPRPLRLIAATAPAPHDVIWRNLYLSNKGRTVRTYSITLVIAILSVAMIVPVSYLASFLELDSIKKFSPALAAYLETRKWALTFITGILPTLLFTFFNFVIPYFYSYLSTLQGFISHGEVELSLISKNFFYVFFNMFLVFTVARASYWTFLKDTTQIAYQLAKTLKTLSLFYVDLIILQGIGMYPFRLLQMGSVMRFPVFAAQCRTPRDYRNLYSPPVFNYGIHLPQPILILIIVLQYSVMSSKIVTFGTIYFVFGYFTYKYQLMYSMVHPQHSTGQAWPLIFRRVCLGLILFHLSMAGMLALQHAYFLATVLAPLPLLTFGYWYNFETTIVPLLRFIALRAIDNAGDGSAHQEASVESDDDDSSPEEWSALVRRPRSRSKTLDEQRERFQKYINPNMVKMLDGPWIGLEGDEVVFIGSEGTMRRRVRFEEWE
jgi:hypothetical protein